MAATRRARSAPKVARVIPTTSIRSTRSTTRILSMDTSTVSETVIEPLPTPPTTKITVKKAAIKKPKTKAPAACAADRTTALVNGIDTRSHTTTMAEAMEHFRSVDPALAAYITREQKRGSPPTTMELPRDESKDIYSSLFRAIVFQQLSGKAASTILRRTVLLCFLRGHSTPELRTLAETMDVIQAEELSHRYKPEITAYFHSPEEVLDAPADMLRRAGLSVRKVEYVRDLASHFIRGTISDEIIDGLPDAQASQLLCSVKGIGPWSSHMYLMLTRRRPNILPAGDLGVRKGATAHFTGAKASNTTAKNCLTEAQVIEYAAKWEPYRSYASGYMWRLADTISEINE